MKNKTLHNIENTGFKTPDHYFKNLEDNLLNLSKLKSKTDYSGLKIPNHYFDDIEHSILSQVKLSSTVEDSGLKIPEGYFKDLEDTILNKIESKKEPKVIPLLNKRTLLYITSTAAAIILFFSLNFFRGIDNLRAVVTLDSIDTELIDLYMLDETDTSELAALFTDTEFNETSFTDYNLSEDTLDNYLENLDDIELILQ